MNDDLDHKRTAKNALSGFFWLASSTAVWQSISWLFTLAIARILLPEDYGIMAFLQTATPYFVLMATLKLDAWIVQEEQLNATHLRTAFTLCCGFATVASFALVLAAPLLAEFYDDGRLTTLYRLLTISICCAALKTVPYGMLRRELRFKAISLVNLTVGLIKSLVQLSMALLGFGYWSLVVGLLLGDLLSCAALWWIARPTIGISGDRNVATTALRYGVYTTGATMLWTLGSTADDIAIGKFLGPETLGYYTVAFMLAEMPLSKISAVLTPILLPYYSRIRSSPENLAQTFMRIAQAIAGVLYPALVGLVLVSPQLIELALGKKWLPMVPMFQVLAIAWIFRSIGTTTSPLLYALGLPNKVFRFQLFSVALVVPSFFGLTYLSGMKGIYFTWCVLYPLSTFYLIAMLRDATGIEFMQFVRNLSPPLIAAALMSGIVLATNSMTNELLSLPTALCLMIVVGALSYAAVMRLCFRETYLDLYMSIQGLRDQ